jgi:hypothetical protein
MKRIVRSLSAALAVFFVALSMLPASADTAPGGSSGLSIQPRKNYVMNPGQTINDKLIVGNLDNSADLNLSLRMIDFTYTDQTGTPKLNLAANAERTPWSLRQFTQLPATTLIPKGGGSQNINYSITIPKNLGAGSYYSAIIYQASSANGGNVALNASGVTLVFVTVPGTVNEKMTLQKFGAYNSEDNGNTGGFVFLAMNNAPKMVGYTLKNEGNVFESPAGSVIIKDIFGHQIASVPTNANQSLALIGQSRLFTSCIKTVQQQVQSLGGASKSTKCVDPKLKPGIYKMNLDVFYGQNGNQTHEITATSYLFYLPIWFLIILALLVAALIWFIWWARKKLQRVVKGTSYKANRGISRRRN